MKTPVRRKPPESHWRRYAAALVCAAALLGASPGGFAAGANDTAAARAARKKQIIHQLVALTNAAQLEAIFSRQFIDRVTDAVALVQPNVDAQTMSVIRNQATAVIHEHIESGDALYSVLLPVYEKHFNLLELAKLQSFYQSPVGQKLIRVSPQLLTESLSLGREWGLSLVPEIIARVQSRLAQENR